MKKKKPLNLEEEEKTNGGYKRGYPRSYMQVSGDITARRNNKKIIEKGPYDYYGHFIYSKAFLLYSESNVIFPVKSPSCYKLETSSKSYIDHSGPQGPVWFFFFFHFFL